jgi:chromosome segregation ATPase
MTVAANEFFHEVDGLASLIVHRYPKGIPHDVLDSLASLSRRAREYARLGVELATREYVEAAEATAQEAARMKVEGDDRLETWRREFDRLSRENSDLRAQLAAIERMDGGE